jgi:small subunit ribosomal protein S20
MAITKSAKKAFRQSQRRRTKNVQRMKKLRSLLKEVAALVSQGKDKEAKKLLPKVYKLLDKAAKTGLIKKNAASRKKSRITRSIIKPQKA